MNSTSKCRHTPHLVDDNGTPQGSWVDRREGSRIKVVCRYCETFYGYRPDDYVRQQLKYERRYREQLARQSCPGCGEVPFGG